MSEERGKKKGKQKKQPSLREAGEAGREPQAIGGHGHGHVTDWPPLRQEPLKEPVRSKHVPLHPSLPPDGL
jgi:hypothetical protein